MEAVFNVLKGPFAKDFRRGFTNKHPELTDKISTKHLKEVQNFVDGYMSCFECMVETPVNESEVSALVMKEALGYIGKKMKG